MSKENSNIEVDQLWRVVDTRTGERILVGPNEEFPELYDLVYVDGGGGKTKISLSPEQARVLGPILTKLGQNEL